MQVYVSEDEGQIGKAFVYRNGTWPCLRTDRLLRLLGYEQNEYVPLGRGKFSVEP